MFMRLFPGAKADIILTLTSVLTPNRIATCQKTEMILSFRNAQTDTQKNRFELLNSVCYNCNFLSCKCDFISKYDNISINTPSNNCLQYQSKNANSISKGSVIQLKQHFIIGPNTISIQNAINKKSTVKTTCFVLTQGQINNNQIYKLMCAPSDKIDFRLFVNLSIPSAYELLLYAPIIKSCMQNAFTNDKHTLNMIESSPKSDIKIKCD